MKLRIIQFIPLILMSALCSYSSPEEVEFHKTELNKIGEQLLDPELSGTNTISLLKQFKVHQDALVSLGGLEKKIFEIKYIPKDSKRFEEFQAEQFKRFKKHPVFPITEYEWEITESGPVHILTVWDTPERMKKWESFIKKFDIPLTE